MQQRSDLECSSGEEEKKGGGASKVAKILENAGRSAEKNILEALEKKNPELAKEVKSYMFTFDDIATLQDIAVQKIVAEVDAKIMAIALKTTTEEMKDKVVKNMSERAAEMLQDEMPYVKDVPEKDVDDAQRKVMVALRDLQGKNEITLIPEQKTIKLEALTYSSLHSSVIILRLSTFEPSF